MKVWSRRTANEEDRAAEKCGWVTRNWGVVRPKNWDKDPTTIKIRTHRVIEWNVIPRSYYTEGA